METSLPNWLATPITSSPQTNHTSATALVKYPRTLEELTLQELTFENFFEAALDRIALGHPLADIAQDDPRGIDPVQMLKWIKKDKERKARFYEAQELSAEFLVSAAVRTASGNDSMNDVIRDKLIVDTSLKVASMYAPKRFGKETGLPTAGGGGITINIGTVDSPYTSQLVEDVTPDQPQVLITDVEDKNVSS